MCMSVFLCAQDGLKVEAAKGKAVVIMPERHNPWFVWDITY